MQGALHPLLDASLFDCAPQVYVTNPDGSPAPRVQVQAEGFQSAGSTQGDGTAKLIINMPGNKQQVPITVSNLLPLRLG